MNPEVLTHQIKPFIPTEAVDIAVKWIVEYKIELTITHSRKSVFGDYHWPRQDKGHRISVNGDLNHYAFLITFVHEMAHLTSWQKFRNAVPSHGREWKTEFRSLMDEFAGRRIFPTDVRLAFKEHLLSPSFSHCVDEKLMKTLRKYDSRHVIFLEDLKEGSLFRYSHNVYQKGEKLRKRYKCIEAKSHRPYFFSAMAEVIPL